MAATSSLVIVAMTVVVTMLMAVSVLMIVIVAVSVVMIVIMSAAATVFMLMLVMMGMCYITVFSMNNMHRNFSFHRIFGMQTNAEPSLAHSTPRVILILPFCIIRHCFSFDKSKSTPVGGFLVFFGKHLYEPNNTHP